MSGFWFTKNRIQILKLKFTLTPGSGQVDDVGNFGGAHQLLAASRIASPSVKSDSELGRLDLSTNNDSALDSVR